MEASGRPKLAFVERSGDPLAAIALAVAHDLGAEASVGLAELVQKRLEMRGLRGATARIHALGFEITTLVSSPEQASHFMKRAAEALATPVGSTDLAFADVRAHFRALHLRTFRSDAEAGVSACSGELGSTAPRIEITPAMLERWRAAVDTTRALAFGVVGGEDRIDAARRAQHDLQALPTGNGPDDPWPNKDLIGLSEGDAERRLSMAWRLPDAAAATVVARSVGRHSSELALRLSALEPPWSIDRASATPRPRGACLRLDITPPAGDPGPELEQVARVALVGIEEVERALRSAPAGNGQLDEALSRASDPRDAAAIAAWRSLTGWLAPEETRRVLNFSERPGDLPGYSGASLGVEMRRSAALWPKVPLDHRERVESGQGELWVLLGNPCGTAAETDRDAGLTATVFRALAARVGTNAEFAIEPWISPDGVGLIAHGPKRSASESAGAHAERIASALARVFVGARLTSSEAAYARSELLAELGPSPAPGYWLSLSVLAPKKPSLLEPRGTFASLSDTATLDVEARHRLIVSGPVRVATLANADAEQAALVVSTLQRWLAPVSDVRARCSTEPLTAPRTGEMTLETSDDLGTNARSYVSVALPARGAEPVPEALMTEWLLNRPGGYFEQALAAPGLASSARARLLGGTHLAALVIEISATPDKSREAVAQVRGLLQRLSDGAVSANDFELAERAVREARLKRSLNPRQRVIELWRGAPAAAPVTLSSLRAFQHAALQPDKHLVVYVKERS